ncbi:MAG: MBOAT family protein [Pseudomonadales bacterium]
MLFNSIEFLVFFLPITIGVFHLLRCYCPAASNYWLAIASLIFYGWWEPRYLVLLLASALVNYLLGLALAETRADKNRVSNILFAIGLSFNVGLLAYYKYAAFLLANVAKLFAVDLPEPTIILPLAISFFTFQQIAYLSDVHSERKAEQSFWRYLLFVTFFPQLIAGPIVHHKEMLPQFRRTSELFSARLIAPAITLIVLGLAKKVLLADSLALFASPGFTVAEQYQYLSSSEAWLSITAYTLQLYFDFSGYCDIALGCALLIGIRLPINFASPYQSASIIDFWRRWHITLSRFMRDYVYIPLGGNRKGQSRWLRNLFATTAVSGLWHGAGWTFIFWGCLHGLMLMGNHLWRRTSLQIRLQEHKSWWFLSVGITFIAVLLAWVYFRSADLASAHYFFSSLFSSAPQSSQSSYLALFTQSTRNTLFQPAVQEMGFWTVAGLLLLPCLFIVFALPNTLRIVGQEKWGFEPLRGDMAKHWIKVRWQPTSVWAIGLGLLLWMVLISLSAVSPFLYFQF